MNTVNGRPGAPRQAHCEQEDLRISLGAYVLDALDEAESQQVRKHLRECLPCQHEYDELVEVRMVLDHARATSALGAWSFLDATPSAAPQPTVPAPNRRRTRQSRPPHRHRRRRRLGLAAAGAVLAGTAGIGGFLLGDLGNLGNVGSVGGVTGGQSGTPPGTRAVAATGVNGITASIRFHPESWGTSMQVTMSNVPADYTCTLTAVAKDGRIETASTWTSGAQGGTVTVPGAVALPASAIDHFDVAVAPGIDVIVPAG
ncbi:hypothetical protein ABH920_003680 [Catenulispora sp. EB89]|uniref:zf-HC2 domain-containing protein n=1 Tax=Catenulispora sp. EB89 TaxID=3156257 RepID=UPI0035192A52